MLYFIYYILYILFYFLCIIFFILYIIYYMLYVICYILYILFYVLYIYIYYIYYIRWYSLLFTCQSARWPVPNSLKRARFHRFLFFKGYPFFSWRIAVFPNFRQEDSWSFLRSWLQPMPLGEGKHAEVLAYKKKKKQSEDRHTTICNNVLSLKHTKTSCTSTWQTNFGTPLY